jgi:hypothetical protein
MEIQDKALRYNEGKPKWHLVHFESLEPMVRVLEEGAKKYAPFNWQKHFELEDLMDSLMRHVTAINKGEVVDKESGQLHMGHIMCNAMFWVYHYNKTQEKPLSQQ